METPEEQLTNELLKRSVDMDALIQALLLARTIEYDSGSGLPTGKFFRIRKYTDGTFDWEELA